MNTAVAEKVAALKAVLPILPAKDVSFAQSLINTVTSQVRAASEKQVYWLDTLAKRAGQPAPVRKTAEIGDMAGVVNMFDRVINRKLKSPAIVLNVPDVGDIRINVAGPRAQVPGSLNVATDGGYGDNVWYGRITRGGVFEASFKQDAPKVLIAKLREFAERPLEVAAEHGRLVGRCCFCNHKLKAGKSTALGYGPVCAKVWVAH